VTESVIFDLWRTLVPLTADHKEAAMAGTAAALGCDTAEFRSTWTATRRRRETMLLLDYLSELRGQCAAGWTDDELDRAMAARRRAHYSAFACLRPDARDVLVELRRRGFGLGLVSNCSSDVRAMLVDAGLIPLFDVVVLSAEVGLMKPDPQIFRRAVQRLGVASGLYVGDGDDGELEGARLAGLVDVLFDMGEGRSGTYRISRLGDVLGLVREARS
jgi:putative hydrolase of the HAD superfamily